MIFAHVAGVLVEEALPSFAGAGGRSLARACLAHDLRRRK